MGYHKDLYEKQYCEKKLIPTCSFQFLREIFKKFDLHREDLALSLLDRGDRLLDVGCGKGSLVCKARDRFDEVYGIDISPSRIKEAKKNAFGRFGADNRMHFATCNINDEIDFPDDMFDAVTSIAVIEHTIDPYFVVSEINRVLKIGGIFVAQVPNIAYIRHRVNLLAGNLPITSSPINWRQIGWDGGHLHYFTKSTFCRLLDESGFKIIRISGSGLFAKFRNFYPSLLTGDICVKARKC